MKELTPEQKQFANEGFDTARNLAKELAEYLGNNTDSSRVAIFAAGILFSSMAALNNVSMHTAISLVMQIYKDVELYEGEEREADE